LKTNTSIQLGIYLKTNQQFIGYAGICKLSKINHSGEYFIFIGEKDFWGKGIATEATKRLIEIGFTKLKLNRIMLTVSEFNIGGIKAYLNAGFKEEGRLRQACYREKKYHDKIVMSILKKRMEKIVEPL
jgi:RimJ/RimL family protein N-acetyltransferase